MSLLLSCKAVQAKREARHERQPALLTISRCDRNRASSGSHQGLVRVWCWDDQGDTLRYISAHDRVENAVSLWLSFVLVIAHYWSIMGRYCYPAVEEGWACCA
ncbi:hypothetical protein BDZ90DRAFT_6101 [Jaminaea rosea]|uniref:WD40 repeat-like protein n=1 Tax=Jaminaea rosea TaxID=1569628 RepID=A0A316UXX8_9BASI|nr:hypothetical protein BDZ90DRAFT_6101 [Jaminaea rosea]PWN30159.1 hypothetical protein BDZ90DRAFT_6101 [Jaminaea rosea]